MNTGSSSQLEPCPLSFYACRRRSSSGSLDLGLFLRGVKHLTGATRVWTCRPYLLLVEIRREGRQYTGYHESKGPTGGDGPSRPTTLKPSPLSVFGPSHGRTEIFRQSSRYDRPGSETGLGVLRPSVRTPDPRTRSLGDTRTMHSPTLPKFRCRHDPGPTPSVRSSSCQSRCRTVAVHEVPTSPGRQGRSD